MGKNAPGSRASEVRRVLPQVFGCDAEYGERGVSACSSTTHGASVTATCAQEVDAKMSTSLVHRRSGWRVGQGECVRRRRTTTASARRTVGAATLTLLMAGAIVLGGVAKPAAAALGAEPDYNCDGVADLAVGVPGESVGAVTSGIVQVFYGSPAGLAANATTLRIGVAGAAGTPATGDGFGSVLASGNFDDDSCTDLAVAAPGADLGAITDAGEVYVFYGSPTGFTSARTARLTRATSGIPGNNQAGEHFGRALGAGDANGDFVDELAIGAPYRDVATAVDAGAVVVVNDPGYSSSNYHATEYHEGAGGVPGVAENNDHFGASITFGNFALHDVSDFSEELAIGAPGENADAVADSGAVFVLPASASGLTGTGAIMLSQNSVGVPGSSERGDAFGFALTAGTLLGADGVSDLAVGVPYEDVGSVVDAGDVIVLGGSTAGLADALSPAPVTLYQGKAGIPDVAERGDHFGQTLIATHFSDHTSQGDLAIGVPLEDVGTVLNAGAVVVVPGIAGALAPSHAHFFAQGVLRVPGTSESGDQFASQLNAGDYDGNGAVDLAVGAPYEDVGATLDAGAFTVLWSNGVTIDSYHSRGQAVSQDTGGVPDTAERGDHFGVL